MALNQESRELLPATTSTRSYRELQMWRKMHMRKPVTCEAPPPPPVTVGDGCTLHNTTLHTASVCEIYVPGRSSGTTDIVKHRQRLLLGNRQAGC